ncbi:hypothetical protein ACSVH2_12210 [Flavobacterium sp. RSB2_4_14]|uniref:hypothetical protein n=1 Tax=Flavobacterium sp. RSB2_4_14 TaxID=3447665 RepID=UPI003F2FE95D
MKNNWLVTSGTAKIEEEKIIYIPTRGYDANGDEFNLTAHVNSDIEFENGTIEFSFKANDKSSICQLVLNTEKTPSLNIGMNTSGSLFGITKYDFEAQRWEWQAGLGNPETFEVDKEYTCKIVVLGSKVTLYVNNIKIIDSTQDIRKGQIKFYISSSNEVIISKLKVHNIKPKAFIVMQFSDEFNNLYTEVIRPICEDNNLECERADEFYTSTPIIADIVKSLNDCSIIIAEISPDNPNVFYEVGYAHAINKPTILLCDRKKRDRLPFDISGFRTLFYEDTIAGKTAIEKNLKKFLETML